MTGPIIPAELWPEGAVALAWDQHGRGKVLVRDEPQKSWFFVYVSTPMPTGWDWRVPVMRPSEQAPAVDLEQYAVAIQYAINGMREAGGITNAKVASKLAGLLALIDGQARLNEPFGNSEQLPPCKIEKPRKGEGSDGRG